MKIIYRVARLGRILMITLVSSQKQHLHKDMQHSVYIRGFTKFGIKVLWRLQFFIGYRTLDLKFQKARTKIEVVLSLPS